MKNLIIFILILFMSIFNLAMAGQDRGGKEMRPIVDLPNYENLFRDSIIKVTKTDVLSRTKLMLKRECNLDQEPLNNDFTCGNLMAMRSPIINDDFADLQIIPSLRELGDLDRNQVTVSELRDFLWSKIPKIFKK